MSDAIKTARDLPDDIDALKALVLSKDTHIALLEEKLRLALLKRFGASSEHSHKDQLHLFNEAEVESTPPESDKDCEVDIASTGKNDTQRTKKPGRKPLPAHLPRVRIEHDIPEADKVCGCGRCKSKIGEETSEQLDIIPAQFQVLQHVRFKYACRHCEGTEDDGPTVITALMPPQPIPKSNASPSLLAYITTAKFCDGIPLYRQEKMFPRIEMDLPRSTMGGWMIHGGGTLIVPLIKRFEGAICDYDIFQNLDGRFIHLQ
ncbi:MAG: IS66 family transposase zinc-finger binding domain-containing protein, partial [Pseudomonadota bacterium]